MYTIKTLNAISPVGLAKLPANQFEIDNEAAAPQGILVRSADMHDAPLPDSLLAIARAGAGTNNIPVEDCTNKGIVVFNTPGANANAVAELVVGALVAGSRNLVDAVNWAQTLKGRDTIAKDVEKGKKAFVGPELRGKTLGVIGLGAIGARVANAAVALGMEVLGYDPYISIDAAWSLSRSVQHCVTLGDMLPRCDYLTIHVPYLPTTRHTINAQTLAMCKDGVRVLNYARGELVDNTALLDIVGRDQPDQELTLGFDRKRCVWEFQGAETELWKLPPDPLLEAVAKMLTPEQPEWSGAPTELLERLPGVSIQANILTRKLNVSADRLYNDYGIRYESRRTHEGRVVKLTLENSGT